MDVDFSPVARAMERCPKKVIQRTGKTILKKAGFSEDEPKKNFSFKAMKDVGLIYKLSAYLFVFEEYQLCYDICSLLDEVQFTGNYGLWDYVSYCRTMKCAICKMNGDEESAVGILSTVVPHEAPELYRNVWKSMTRSGLRLQEEYNEGVEKSVIRYQALGIAIGINHYIQLDALVEYRAIMDEWYCKIIEYIRAEEK